MTKRQQITKAENSLLLYNIYVVFLHFQQCNDVCLMAYLGTLTKGCNTMNQVC